jgi:hypothetical protein
VTGIVNLEKWENNQGRIRRIRRRRKEKEKDEMRISMGGLDFQKHGIDQYQH